MIIKHCHHPMSYNDKRKYTSVIKAFLCKKTTNINFINYSKLEHDINSHLVKNGRFSLRHILKSLANHLSFMFHCTKPLFLGKFISLFLLEISDKYLK